MDELIQLRKKIVELEKNDRLFKETEKSGKIGGWQFDPSTLKQTWSEEIFRILEIDLAKGALEVPKGMEFIDPEFRPMAEKAVQRAMEHGEPYDQEWMATTAKGNKKWVNAVCNPKMENGKVVSVSGSFQDITSEKIVEQELLKNQKRYEKAQAIGNVGNWEYNPVSTNFWASDETKRIYGYDLNMDNFSTEIVENCIPERERVHQALLDLLEHNKKYDLVFDIITYDKGVRKTIRSIAEVERDANGNPLKVTGVISDITVQKKAEDKLNALNQQLLASEQQLKASNQQLQANEQQLKAANQQLSASEQQLKAANQQLSASEQQLKAANQQLRAANQQLQEAKERAENSEKYLENIIKNIADPIFVKDEESKLLVVNDAFCKLFGLNKENIIGKDLVEDVSPAERESFLRIDKMVLNDGKENVNEESLTVRGGLTKIISTKKSRFLDEKGRKFLIGVIRDITESTKAEEILKESERKLLEAQELSHLGNWEYNAENDTVIWSKELYNIFERSYDLPAPRYSEQPLFYTEESFAKLDKALQNCVQQGIPYEIELDIVTSSGSKKHIISKGRAKKDKNDKVIGAVGTALDITDRKKVEEELIKYKDHLEELVKKRTVELEKKNEALKQLNSVFVGRELRMAELKDKIKELEGKE